MQYANTIINHKAGFQALTYSIPPTLLPYLERGSVVLVPFGKQTVHGVIDQFIGHISPELTTKLKPIQSIVYSGTAIDGAKLDATRWLCQEWGLSRGQTLFRLLPQMPKRRQTIAMPSTRDQSHYEVHEYQVGLADRINWYKRIYARLKRSQKSGWVIVSSHVEAQNLTKGLKLVGCHCILYPDQPTPKQRRIFWLQSGREPRPTLYIGTRGMLVIALSHISLIIVDEPWLPGHKDDASPKLWSVFNANALARACNIPLLLVSSLLWPENCLLPVKRTHRQIARLGSIRLTPKRGLAEQLTHWLTESEGLNRAIVIHQTHHETMWCGRCQKIVVSGQNCPDCGTVTIILPKIGVETITTALGKVQVPVVPIESYASLQSTDCVLAMNFDAYLTLTDWRVGLYLGTVLRHFQEKSTQTHFVTSHPDTWTRLLNQLSTNFYDYQLAIRQSANLPPYSLLVRITADQKDVLIKFLPLELPNLIQVGSIHRLAESYALTILMKPHAKLPPTWSQSSLFKLDILPLYLNS